MEDIDPKLHAKILKSIERHEIRKLDAEQILDWAGRIEWAHVCLMAVMQEKIEICGVKNGEPLFKKVGSNSVE